MWMSCGVVSMVFRLLDMFAVFVVVALVPFSLLLGSVLLIVCVLLDSLGLVVLSSMI